MKKYLLILFLIVSILFCLFLFRDKIRIKIKSVLIYIENRNQIHSGECVNCSFLFHDLIPEHEKAYDNNQGIKPQNNFRSLDKLLQAGVLVELKSNSFYTIRKSDYSKPYILPKGYNFIQELARLYMKNCKNKSIEYIPFTITSITRTLKSVAELVEGNPNAIKKSAHLRGKTFDVSYHEFSEDKKQCKCFIDALQTLHKLKKCYVKFERNGCLHITAN